MSRMVLVHAGQEYGLFWGNACKGCEVDFALKVVNGPLIWGSCKLSEAQQTRSAFLPHIKALAVSAGHAAGAQGGQILALKQTSAICCGSHASVSGLEAD